MKATFISLLLFCASIAKAQNNIFPASGNVGIGTVTPTVGLELINNTITEDAKLYLQQTNPDVGPGLGSAEIQLKSNKGNTTFRFLSYSRGGSYIESGTYDFTSNQPLNFTGFSGYQGSNLNFNFLTSYFSGKVGIGTTTPGANLDINGTTYSRKVFVGTPDASTFFNMGSNLLAVNGTAVFVKAKVALYGTAWPDYVFNPTYKLPELDSLEQFIQLHKHLPEVPSASDVEENGIDVGQTQALLLKKIEELTLNIIELNKKQKDFQKIIIEQNKKMKNLDSQLQTLLNK